MKIHNLTDTIIVSPAQLIEFIESVEAEGGGNFDFAYEAILFAARQHATFLRNTNLELEVPTK